MNISRNPLELLAQDPVQLSLFSLKSKLMMVITTIIRDNEWTQKQASVQMDVAQPRISNLMNGQISKFSIDMLIEMLGKVGYLMDISFNSDSIDKPLSIDVKKTAV